MRAAPVDADRALDAATGWVRLSPSPMGRRAGLPGHVDTVTDSSGAPLFHVVKLVPSGFAVIAADDELETVLAFSPDGEFVPQAGHGLFELLRRDVPQRLQAARAASAAGLAPSADRQRTQAKWRTLLARSGRGAASVGDREAAEALRMAEVSDVRVAPMIETRWSQTTARVGGSLLAIYNYYTPPYTPGVSSNYPAGCVATAWAQIMRFHRWPQLIGPQSIDITVDKATQSRPMRGGDGNGGAYAWGQMVNDPTVAVTLEQRQAIGALLHDAGVGLGMQYAPDSSGANLRSDRIKEVFKYASAVYVREISLEEARLALRTNLDAGLPAGIAVWGTEPGGRTVGHEPVADGYGYNVTTLYHHLNLGWGGESDAWYNLPMIDDGHVGFPLLDACTYNIMPEARGEIVSGRITAPDGAALPNVTVTLNDGSDRTATTNERGIFAFKGVASSRAVSVTPRTARYVFQPAQASVTTGSSQDFGAVGNRIADFSSQPRTADTPYTPVITWPAPSAIGEGSPVSSRQLNATADVPGTFTYAPVAGTVLPLGTHVLSVTFAPDDPTIYRSATAQVSVTVLEGRSTLANISARAYCATGDNMTFGGFVIAGSGSKRVLVRAIGPSLTKFGLTDAEVLRDPMVEVHDRSSIIAENNNWGDNANLAEIESIATRIGAAPLLPTDTTSSVALLTLGSGAYTFTVRGQDGGAGIVLLEVYDVDPENVGTKFCNISARGYATTNNGVTIGGFVIAGNLPKRVLMRAFGPSLTGLGLGAPLVLADPVIELHHGSPTIGTNDDWGSTDQTDIRTTGARVGAIPFDQTDTKSSALLVTLDPGSYSFIARGKNDTSGIVLVEVYDAD